MAEILLTKTELNEKGQISKISFFSDTNESGELLNLTRTEEFNYLEPNGIPIQKTTTVKNFKQREETESFEFVEILTLEQGMKINRKAREQIILKAQAYLLEELEVEFEKTNGWGTALNFLSEVSNEITKYEQGTKFSLILAIQESEHEWLTTERKNYLTNLLL